MRLMVSEVVSSTSCGFFLPIVWGYQASFAVHCGPSPLWTGVSGVWKVNKFSLVPRITGEKLRMKAAVSFDLLFINSYCVLSCVQNPAVCQTPSSLHACYVWWIWRHTCRQDCCRSSGVCSAERELLPLAQYMIPCLIFSFFTKLFCTCNACISRCIVKFLL